MIQNIRQVRRKETSLSHPSTSLHLIQLSRFLQDYNHSRILHNINLNAACIQSFLPIRQQISDSFDLIKDVPYIQSEHYESNQTFASEPDVDSSSSDENFTDDEQVEQDLRQVPKLRKFVMMEQEEEFRDQDFQFVANTKSNKESVATFPHSSTIYSQSNDINEEDIELYRLRQTAYFSQAPQPEHPSKRLSYGIEEKENYSNNINKRPPEEKISTKAMFLNKIEKEKTKKDKIDIRGRGNWKKRVK